MARDDTRRGARNLGVLTRRRTIRDSLNFSALTPDYDDFFKFRLTGRSGVSLVLNGLDANADLRLLRGGENVETIRFSRKRGKRTERINRTLDAGEYLIQVSQDGVNTKYALTLSTFAPGTGGGGSGGGGGGDDGGSGGGGSNIDFNSPPPVTPSSEPGNLPATAFNAGALSGIRSYRTTVGGTDTADFYRVNVGRSARVTVATGNVSGGSVETSLVYDVNGNNVVDSNDVIGTGNVITKALGAGTYFVGVTPTSGQNVTYTLRLEEIAVAGVTGTPDPAMGLTDATDLGALRTSLNVQQLVSPSDTTKPQLVGTFDSTDIYRFTLENYVNFSALLNSSQLTGEVTMSLIYDDGDPRNGGTEVDDRNRIANPGEDRGGVIGGDFLGGVFTGSSAGGSALAINKDLGAGTYYLAVTQREIADGTTYNLNLAINSVIPGVSPINEPNPLVPNPFANPFVDNRSLATAFPVGPLTQNVNFKQFVGAVDGVDVYSFTLTQESNVILRYNGTPELVVLRFGADRNNSGFLGDEPAPDRATNPEVFPQQLFGNVVYSPLPPFFDPAARFDPVRNGFLTSVPTDIYARLPAGTYYIEVDAQATTVDLGDGLTRYGSANVLYNLSFILEGQGA